jgi:hypothetical protein
MRNSMDLKYPRCSNRDVQKYFVDSQLLRENDANYFSPPAAIFELILRQKCS